VTERPRVGGTLRIAHAGRPAGFDPTLHCAGDGRLFGEQLYETLTRLDDAGLPGPGLAETFERSSDGRAYEFRLRPGATFSDGRPVTAEDVAFTFRRQTDPATDYHHGHWAEPIVAAEPLDTARVRIRLDRPVDALPTWLAFHGSAIVPAERAAAGTLGTAPIGSGPYVLADAGPDRVRLVRRPDLPVDAPPFIEALEFVRIPDEQAVDALLDGAVDLVPAAQPTDWSRTEATGIARQARLDGRWHWLSLNTRNPPFDDVRVRRAVALAIDRTAVVDEAFLGYGVPILGVPIPPWSWGARPDLDWFRSRPELVAARGLVADAGVAPGTAVRLRLAGFSPTLVAEGAVARRAFEALGFTVAVDVIDERESYLAEVWRDRRDFDATTMHWGSTMVDPDDFLAYGYRCGMKNNVEGWCDPAFDRALEAALAAHGPAARAPLYDEPGRIVLEALPRIPLAFGELLTASTDRLRNFRIRPNGSLLGLHEAWLAD
jgi:peptide/nickel transport system substrate-binding protein